MEATKKLQEGQEITVDGANGKIYEGNVKPGSVASVESPVEIETHESPVEQEVLEAADGLALTKKPKIYMNSITYRHKIG